MLNVHIAIAVNGRTLDENAGLPTIVVTSESFRDGTHFEVKVTDEGVILEVWDEQRGAFVASRAFEYCDFADLFDL